MTISIDSELDFPLSTNEKEALRIALGVLRSGTDYGDFLNSWLQDYGPLILSSNPSLPLLNGTPFDEELQEVIEDMPRLIH